MAQIEGMKELSSKLVLLGTKLGGKALRQAASAATTPALREMKAAIPVGSTEHKTYKGRLVAPGFAKRSIRRQARLRKGTATVTIGVLPEAFYAVSFADRGTKNMTAQPWFESRFENNQRTMTNEMVKQLKARILKIAAKRS